MAEPCRCTTAEQARQCQRGGTVMSGSMHDLCRGVGRYSAQESDAYRTYWDSVDWGHPPGPAVAVILDYKIGAERLRKCLYGGRALIRTWIVDVRRTTRIPLMRPCQAG